MEDEVGREVVNVQREERECGERVRVHRERRGEDVADLIDQRLALSHPHREPAREQEQQEPQAVGPRLLAVRDVEEEEVKIMERLNIKNYGVEDLHMIGEELLAEKILGRLSACDVIYISFDVDSMDPLATSHGTGTPVENGLLPSQAENLMLKILESGKVVCLEVVEVNPCLDEKTNKMAETALKIIESLLEKI